MYETFVSGRFLPPCHNGAVLSSFRWPARGPLLTLWLVGALLGCGDSTTGLPDGDVGPTGIPCAADDACDDGIDCTDDRCGEDGFCVFEPNDVGCQDGLFCTGREICDPSLGCQPARRAPCDDVDVCTRGICDEATRRCETTPLDLDDDGEVDFRCPGGTDCDDRNARVGLLRAETCGDELDNDCDDEVDEAMCGGVTFDGCADALDVSAGGVFSLSTAGTAGSETFPCLTAADGSTDAALTFTLDSPRNVDLRATADGPTRSLGLLLRSSCEDSASNLACATGVTSELRVRALPAGTYTVWLYDESSGPLSVTATFSDPTEPAPQSLCATPWLIDASISLEADLLDAEDSASLPCGTAAAGDHIYRVELDAPANVRLLAVDPAGAPMTVAWMDDCAADDSVRRCLLGEPVDAMFYGLPAGSHDFVVEGPGGRAVPYLLTVDILPPSAPPASDVCEGAGLLVPLETTQGAFGEFEDDYAVSCGAVGREAVYRLQVDQPSDVRLVASGGGELIQVALQDSCGDVRSERVCAAGTMLDVTTRNVAVGTYAVLVQSYRAAGFAVMAELAPPTPTLPAQGNDVCESAIAVPEGGAVFVGDTTDLQGDYLTRSCGSEARGRDAVFRIEVAESSVLKASTDGSAFDTVLYLKRDPCTAPGELACAEGAGLGSTLETTLEPGTYFLVLDGYGPSSFGAYQLLIELVPA